MLDYEVEFAAEVTVHPNALKNLAIPRVLLHPRLVTCLNCGFSRFTIPEAELKLLSKANESHQASRAHA
jgi:hypothetical protein